MFSLPRMQSSPVCRIRSFNNERRRHMDLVTVVKGTDECHPDGGRYSQRIIRNNRLYASAKYLNVLSLQGLLKAESPAQENVSSVDLALDPGI